MYLRESFKTAWWSLQTNKLRSFLSMLGIIIGVAAVVSVVSISMGAQQAVLGSISQLGSNLIMINTRATLGRFGSVSTDVSELFTLEMAEELEKRAPGIVLVAPQVQGSGLLMYGGINRRTSILGVAPQYTQITNYAVAQGRFVHGIDVQQATNVIVLGSRVANDLFPNANPVGQELTIVMNDRRYTFLVVGVMEAKGQVFMGNYDSQAYIPISTGMERLFRLNHVNSYLAQANPQIQPAEAVAQAEYFLTARLGQDEGFQVTSQDEMLETMGQVTQVLQLLLGSIAGISLLVGGIGVMNIMLVSVTERTQEIGTRKALGAKKRDLLSQFIVETIILSASGGMLGLIIGTLGARVVGMIGGWPVLIVPSSLVLAFSLSAVVGLASGVYPAMKAARLDPVVALSYE